MKCPRCNTIYKKKNHCPVCLHGIQNAISQLTLEVEPINNRYKRTVRIYVTEYNGDKTFLGKLTDWYMGIDLIVKLLCKFPRLVTVIHLERKNNDA